MLKNFDFHFLNMTKTDNILFYNTKKANICSCILTYNVDYEFLHFYNLRKTHGDDTMNLHFAKTILYAYANLEEVIEEIDEIVERKALCSMNDYSPCLEQCERIINLIGQKDVLIDIKIKAEKVLKKFTDEELDYFDYKYFKIRPKDYYEDFDSFSRNYFRRQVKLANKFSRLIELEGITKKYFEDNCMQIDFMRELLKRVIEHEKLSYKNKPNRVKKASKNQQNIDMSNRKIA